MTGKDIENWFTYHPPSEETVTRLKSIRDKAKEMAALIFALTPSGADQDAALRKLRECVMTANAAIVIPQLGVADPDKSWTKVPEHTKGGLAP